MDLIQNATTIPQSVEYPIIPLGLPHLQMLAVDPTDPCSVNLISGLIPVLREAPLMYALCPLPGHEGGC